MKRGTEAADVDRAQPGMIRALLIEDNPGDAGLIRQALSEAGPTSFRVEVHERLETGLAHATDGDVDVVVLDLSLPDCTGFETFLRARAGLPDLPIVVLTGLAGC